MNTNRRLAILFSAFAVVGFGVASLVASHSSGLMVREALRNLDAADSFWTAVTVATFAPDEAVKAAGADPSKTILPVVFVGEGGVRMPKSGVPSGTLSFTQVSGKESSKDTTVDLRALPDGSAFMKVEHLANETVETTPLKVLDGKWFSLGTAAEKGDHTKDGPVRDVVAVSAAWSGLREAATSGLLFGEVANLGSQSLGDVSTRRFSLPLRQQAMGDVATNLAVLTRGRPITDLERAEIVTASALHAGTLDLWINPKNKHIVQAALELRGVADKPKENGLLSTSHLRVLLRFTAWNESVDVVAPEKSESLPDAFLTLKSLNSPAMPASVPEIVPSPDTNAATP